MYKIETFIDGFPVYELIETETDSRFRIVPQRGGIGIGLTLRGRELLYLDRDTFLDVNANVRGGNPILFPISGQLKDGAYEWEGKQYRMGNHGVARNLPWEVVDTRTEGEAAITLRLTANEWTLQQYPFQFELTFTYRLQGAKLTIEQQYRHLIGTEGMQMTGEMPMYPGFHPYFVADSNPIQFHTKATTLYGFGGGKGRPFTGSLTLEEMVPAPLLQDEDQGVIRFEPQQGTTVVIRYGDAFRYVVLWTAADRKMPFFCVEPWMAKSGELHRGQELVRLAPGEELRTWLSIETEQSGAQG